MIKNFFQPKVMLFFIIGLAFCIVFMILGDADDAPGLSFIGIIVAFLLIMRGIFHAKVLRKGCHMPVILFVFGAIGVFFPIILLLDGEIVRYSIGALIGNAIGVLLIAAACGRLINLKRKS